MTACQFWVHFPGPASHLLRYSSTCYLPPQPQCGYRCIYKGSARGGQACGICSCVGVECRRTKHRRGLRRVRKGPRPRSGLAPDFRFGRGRAQLPIPPPTCPPPSTRPPLYLRCVQPPLMRPGPACTLPKLRGRKKSGTAVAGHLAQSFFLIARQPTAAPRPSAHRDAAPPTHTRHRTAAGGGCPPCAHPISLCSDDGLSQSGHIQVCRNRGEPLRTCPDHRDTPVESNSR